MFKETVIRGGYGINYNTGQYATFAQQLSAQPPFAVTQTNIVGQPGCTLGVADAGEWVQLLDDAGAEQLCGRI